MLQLSLALTALWAWAAPSPAGADTVNVYSYREPGLMQPLLDAFTRSTGVTVNLVFAKDGLIERMAAEGRNSPADVLLTNEFGLLTQAQGMGVTQAVTSAELEQAIPATLRDPAGHWFALTRRARVVYASRERVAQNAITYLELADPKWRGRICSRSGQHAYNVALVAAMIAHLGEAGAKTWLEGVKANLARKPAGGDREQVRDVHAGLCDLAIGNTYYMGAMQTNSRQPEQKQWAASVKVLFPDAAGQGTHVNISGMALARHAPDRAAAIKLMEFLAGPMAQQIYAEANHEYPARAGVAVSPLVAAWGDLVADTLPLATVAGLRKQASELVDKVNFDAGPSS